MDKHQTVVITGTSKGMGKMLASFFLAQGHRVFGCSRSETDLVHENYTHTAVDVTDEQQVMSWVRSIKRAAGRIDILICNAADTSANKLVATTTGADLDRILQINFRGTFLVCREVSKIMMLQKYGRIINVSSMSVGLHEEGTAAYSASKSAVVEFTRILAKEMARFQVTCNVVAPSVYLTEQVQENLGGEILKKAVEQLTIKMPLSDQDICHTIQFLAHPFSGQITGQVLYLGLVV